MPTTPYPVSGTITKANGSVLASGTVQFKNYTQGGQGFKADIQTDGTYLCDMANFENGWNVSDEIWVKVSSDNYYSYTSYTVVSGDTKTLNITAYGANQYIFREMYDLINDSVGSDWTVVSSMPNDIADFPIIILEVARNSQMLLDMTRTEYECDIDIDLRYYSKNKDGTTLLGKGYLDIERDNTRNTIFSNKTLLDFKGIYLKNDWIDDSNQDSMELSGQKVNVAMQVVKLRFVK